MRALTAAQQADLDYAQLVRIHLRTYRQYARTRWLDADTGALISPAMWAEDCLAGALAVATSPTGYATTEYDGCQVAIRVAMFKAAYRRAGGNPDELGLP